MHKHGFNADHALNGIALIINAYILTAHCSPNQTAAKWADGRAQETSNVHDHTEKKGTEKKKR